MLRDFIYFIMANSNFKEINLFFSLTTKLFHKLLMAMLKMRMHGTLLRIIQRFNTKAANDSTVKFNDNHRPRMVWDPTFPKEHITRYSFLNVFCTPFFILHLQEQHLSILHFLWTIPNFSLYFTILVSAAWIMKKCQRLCLCISGFDRFI